MDEGHIQQVRSFNRALTRRIGVLGDNYLERGRPLAESRLLWEIGRDGADVRELRARLSLDSGYVSRLLRALEGQQLVVVETGGVDRRLRRVHLTGKGRRERMLLDRRSDALARGLLRTLDASQQSRLLGAMEEIERLLNASLVEVAVEDPDAP